MMKSEIATDRSSRGVRASSATFRRTTSASLTSTHQDHTPDYNTRTLPSSQTRLTTQSNVLINPARPLPLPPPPPRTPNAPLRIHSNRTRITQQIPLDSAPKALCAINSTKAPPRLLRQPRLEKRSRPISASRAIRAIRAGAENVRNAH